MKYKRYLNQILRRWNIVDKLPLFIVVGFALVFGFSVLKENLTYNLQLSYSIPNSFVNSIVVALDSTINPNGAIAAVNEIRQKATSGDGILVEDVFRRCQIQSENRTSKAYFQLYDSKIGVNQGDIIGGSSTGQDIRDYFRWENRASLDMALSQKVGIISEATNETQVVDYIIKSNEDGFIPIIRIGFVDLGDFKFDLVQNSDEMVNFYTEVGKKLMDLNKGYRAVISFGPNEPDTGLEDISSVLGIDYSTMVKRQNQAADRLQKYRVVNGGVFWFAPSIFNGTQSFVANGKEYSYDVYHHLYIGGEDSTQKDYDIRPNIDPDIFDAMLLNVYSVSTKTAWEFYRDFGLKDYVDKRTNLVTIITEFGVAPGNDGMKTEDLKDEFKQLYDDPKIEGINFFRAIKDKPSLDPQPPETQRLEIEDFIRFAEQSNKSTKKISLKIDSWLNCNLSSSLYESTTTNSGGSTPPLNIKTKGGLNEGTIVGGDFSGQISKAKELGLSGFTLGMATSPSQVDATVSFINQSISAGMVPIVRLCYLGSPGSPRGENCSFDLSGGKTSDVVNFYKSVSQKASGTFIGIIGPNEPGTGFPEGLGEMKGFGLNSYDEAVASANKVGAELQGTPKMLIAPAAFNLINPQNNDFEQYRNKGLNASLFDVIIGNAYDAGGFEAATAINSALSYAKSNGMKFIVTETGTIEGQSSKNFEETAAALCSKVDGFLMFRSVQGFSNNDGNYANKPKLYSAEQLKSFAKACKGSGGASDTSSDSNVIPVADVSTNSCTGGVPENQIIFVGDSLTDWLARRVFTGVPEKFEIGEPGASTFWFIPGGQKGDQFSNKVKAAAADAESKALFLMLGTNDCGGVSDSDFRNNLTTIVNYIKASAHSNLKIYLSTIPNARRGCSTDKITAYNNIIRAVQSSSGMLLRDVGNFTDSDTTDGVHLTNQAYARIANKTRELLGSTCPVDPNTSGGSSSTSGGSSSSTPDIQSIEAGSTALACGREDDKPATFYRGKNAAALRVRCSGGSCTTKMIGTVDIEAPIKIFASNSPNGTLRNRFTPVSQIAAKYSNIRVYDALNMFAGEIKVGSQSYGMPGLGSATNSSFGILRDSMTERFVNYSSPKSTGSLAETTEFKLKGQVEDNKTIPILGNNNLFSSISSIISVNGQGTNITSIDDRAVCFDGTCFNNDAGTDIRKTLLPYDPIVSYNTYFSPKACEKTDMKFKNNLDNYITGPEMIVKDQSTVFNGTTQDVCWLYAGRSIPGRTPYTSGDGVKTCGYIFDNRIFPGADINALSPDNDKPVRRVFTTFFDPITGRNVTTSRIEYENWTCKELFDGRANASDAVFEEPEFANAPVPDGPRLPECDFDDYEFELNKGDINPSRRSGNCDIEEKYKQCLRYDPQESDQIYIHTEDYPSVPKVQIPNMYSAIFGIYDRIQTTLSQRNVKLVVQENIGMKLKVNSKIRDANETVAEQEYNFSKVYDNYSTLPKLIDNKNPLASNNSTKTQFQYFDDIGYVDYLQELFVTYTMEPNLITDNIIDNPFSGASNPFPGRTKILAGGSGNVLIGQPILTCDQVEICKRFSFDELKNTYGEKKALSLCPLKEKIPTEEKRNCITFLKDDRFEDTLKDKLCSRGFPVSDGCEFQCKVDDNDDGDENDGGDDGSSPPINGNYPNTTCPVEDSLHRCFQGPYGSYTHNRSQGLPLDLYPNFTNGSANASNRNKDILAPEGGSIVEVINNGGEGTRITLQAKSGIRYFILHLNGNDPNLVKVGDEVRAGQRIAEIASQATVPGLAYNDSNIHTHVRAELNGQHVDPYYLFGEILNCNAKKPDESWAENRDLSGLSDAKAYCVKSSAGKFLLNDNGPSRATKPTPINNQSVKNAFDSAYGQPTSLINTNVLASAVKTTDKVIKTTGQVLGTNTISTDFKIRIPSDSPSAQFTSNYGSRCYIDEGVRQCNFHTGIDIAYQGIQGTPVVAAESGKVIQTGFESNGYGHYVKIVHPNGMSTLYAHNSAITVRVGDCVKIGQEIAKAGSTGNSTGPHIHLEIRKDPNCKIDDYSPTSKQDCAVNPAQYLSPGKRESSFSDEDLKTVCDGNLPDGGDKDNLVCLPEDDSPEVEPGQTYGNVFSLLEKVESITGVDKYYLAGILSLESGPELQRSVGNYIKNGTALYKGDPLDIGNPNPNSASAVGPFQFICRTGVSYFYPPGSTNLPCQPWSSGSQGRYYNKVLACVKALGMNYNDGDILDPKYFGVGACGAATMFSGLEGQSISSYDIGDIASRSNSNPFWRAAGAYNGGGNYESIPISKWYADSTVGRAFFFKKHWSAYKSGDKGSDCDPAFRDWYYYHVDLGVQCISRGPQDGQCRVTSKAELDVVCKR